MRYIDDVKCDECGRCVRVDYAAATKMIAALPVPTCPTCACRLGRCGQRPAVAFSWAQRR
jgi:hypothetical protein